MNRRIFGLVMSLLFTLLAVTRSPAVEFGQDATGDPNAVHIMANVSGFLYSERIIFTAAHTTDQLQVQPNGDATGFVFAPGLADKANAKRYKIVKVFRPRTYVSANPSQRIQALDDFAIIVVSEDMPLKRRVLIPTEQEMIRFAQDKVRVEMVGYGLQSGSQRNLLQGQGQDFGRAPHKLSATLLTPEMMNDHYKRYGNAPGFWTKIEWGANSGLDGGSPCSGDSGSGYFVEQDSIRYYVGTAGNGQGNSNCRSDGLVSFADGGAMSWFPAPYKFLDLLEDAEEFVAGEKQKEYAKAESERLVAELKAKQEAESKANLETQKKKTITCVKGKLTKKVKAVRPKCPAEYRKASR